MKAISRLSHKVTFFALEKNRPTGRSGIMSLTNICGSFPYKGYLSGSDSKDLRSDWEAVGKDIAWAMKRIKR